MDGHMLDGLGTAIVVMLIVAAILGGCGVLGIQCAAKHVRLNVEMVR